MLTRSSSTLYTLSSIRRERFSSFTVHLCFSVPGSARLPSFRDRYRTHQQRFRNVSSPYRSLHLKHPPHNRLSPKKKPSIISRSRFISDSFLSKPPPPLGSDTPQMWVRLHREHVIILTILLSGCAWASRFLFPYSPRCSESSDGIIVPNETCLYGW